MKTHKVTRRAFVRRTAVGGAALAAAPYFVPSTACHLGNIARWTGKRLKWDPVAERFDDAAANQYLDRARRKPYELPAKV